MLFLLFPLDIACSITTDPAVWVRQAPLQPLDDRMNQAGSLLPMKLRSLAATCQRRMRNGGGCPAWTSLVAQRSAEARDAEWFQFLVQQSVQDRVCGL